MTPENYILSRLQGIKVGDTKLEGDLPDAIYKAVMAKKFRKYSVSGAGQNHIRSAIALCIKNNEPIKIAIPFGSYKLWKLEESPEPDWAELFAMIYYSYWLKPITDIYTPGVWFDFCGDDAILELMNNIPTDHTERYKNVFRALLAFLHPYLPDNCRYTFSPVGERYGSQEEFLDDLNQKVEELKKKKLEPITPEQREMMMLNVRLNPGEEIDFERNRLLHDAYLMVSKRRPHHKGPDKILISATPFGDRTSVPLGTTKTSVVKFQTGTGVLKKSHEGFMEYILSPSQVHSAAYNWELVAITGLKGKNFSRIRVVPTVEQ